MRTLCLRVSVTFALMAVALTMTACGNQTTSQTESKPKLTRDYQCAPAAPRQGSLVWRDDWLTFATATRVYSIYLGGDSASPAIRLDEALSPNNAIADLIQGEDDTFVLLPDAFEAVTVAAVLVETSVADCWSDGLDYILAQYAPQEKMWVFASHGTFGNLGVGYAGKRTSTELGPHFQSEINLIPGAMGHLARVTFTPEDGKDQAGYWFNPLTGAKIVIPGLGEPREGVEVWVDQGRVFSSAEAGITDHGPLAGVRVVKASENASALSPWRIERSPDKATLTVRSIYAAGRQYVIEKPNGLWTQDTAPYGLHALTDLEDVYDLRTGKLAFTVDLSQADAGDWLIRTADGFVVGTDAMLAKKKPTDTKDWDRVRAVMNDVLRRGPATDETE